MTVTILYKKSLIYSGMNFANDSRIMECEVNNNENFLSFQFLIHIQYFYSNFDVIFN